MSGVKYDIQVVNKHHKAQGTYIGRGSPLGNPFKVGPLSRHQAIVMYEDWLKKRIQEQDTAVCRALNAIGHAAMDGPVKLLCFCAPKPCHGDVIKRVVLEALNKQGT